MRNLDSEKTHQSADNVSAGDVAKLNSMVETKDPLVDAINAGLSNLTDDQKQQLHMNLDQQDKSGTPLDRQEIMNAWDNTLFHGMKPEQREQYRNDMSQMVMGLNLRMGASSTPGFGSDVLPRVEQQSPLQMNWNSDYNSIDIVSHTGNHISLQAVYDLEISEEPVFAMLGDDGEPVMYYSQQQIADYISEGTYGSEWGLETDSTPTYFSSQQKESKVKIVDKRFDVFLQEGERVAFNTDFDKQDTINTLLSPHPESIWIDYSQVDDSLRDAYELPVGIVAYWDTSVNSYVSTIKPHNRKARPTNRPFVFSGIIIENISDKHEVVSQRSPYIEMDEGISYSFPYATRERVDTLLCANQGIIELDYSASTKSDLGKLTAQWNDEKQTYVDTSGKRVRVYDGVIISKTQINKEKMRQRIDDMNSVLYNFLNKKKTFSQEELFPSISSEKKDAYQEYFSDFADNAICLDTKSTYIQYDENTQEPILRYELDNNGANYFYNKGLSMSTSFMQDTINEEDLITLLASQVKTIIDSYIYVPKTDSADQISNRETSSKETIPYESIIINKSYRVGNSTYCSKCARDVAKDYFAVNIPQGDAKDAVDMPIEDADTYEGTEIFSDRYQAKKSIKGVSKNELHMLTRQAERHGASMIDLGLHSGTSNGLKYGHRVTAFFRPEQGERFFLDPLVNYGGGISNKPMPLNKITQWNKLKLYKAHFYDAPVSVVG